jgi:mono/diheme cytochrome c family protein
MAVLAPFALSACEPGPEWGSEAPDTALAVALFAEHCAICHAEDGSGRGLRRRSLYVKPPDFRRLSWRRGRTLESVRDAIREGRPGTDMPAWKQLDPDETTALAFHVLGFSQPEGRP